ncbi:MAG: 5'/3'-nucleotidase SurE [candidate division Zixibacteria bacterium]|nr:5'/3'-nucleotidase SurE [candidate division Zixibacteria bacterium]
MIALLTNDDGIEAKGIKALEKEISKIVQVWVVAPDREQSATSHSLTLTRPLRVNKVKDRAYSIDGTPTDAVMVAFHKLLKRKPDILISGINSGPNLGDDVTYSGTVAAAIEGTILGIPSIAVSVTDTSFDKYEYPAMFVRKLTNYVLKNGLPKDTFLNVNIPPSRKSLTKYKITRLGRRVYKDVVVEKIDPRGKKYFWIAGQAIVSEGGKDSDFLAIEKGYVSITPLHLDWTNYKTIVEMKGWKIF